MMVIGIAENKRRPADTALGVLDMMSWRCAYKGSAQFRSLPLVDQHTLLMKAWGEKGNAKKAQENALKVYEEKMLWGHYQDAIDIALKHGLAEQVKRAAEELHLRLRAYDERAAEKIAEKYGLFKEMFRHRVRVKDFQGAIKIAKEHDLGKEMESFAAERLCSQYLQIQEYELALLIAEDHGLKDCMRDAATGKYGKEMELKNYEGAARVAQKYGLYKEMKCAALKAYRNSMWKMEFFEAGLKKDVYGLEEDEAENVVLDVCEESIRFGRHGDTVLSIANNLNVADRIPEIALRIYQEKMRDGDYKEAVRLAQDYDLKEQKKFLSGFVRVLNSA